MNSKIRNGMIGVLALFGLTASQATVIDFEGFAAGTIIDDDIAGVTISAITNGFNTPDVAIVFDSDNPTGGDWDLGAPFIQNGNSSTQFFPGNILILQERNDCNATSCAEPDDNARGGRMTFQFDTPVTLNSIDFFDIENHESGSGVNAYGMAMFATTNGSGMDSLIGMWTVPSTGGNNTWGTLDFGGLSGVTRLEIVLLGSGAVDNLDYTVVPLPAAAWLLGSALAGIAALRRRRLGLT